MKQQKERGSRPADLQKAESLSGPEISAVKQYAEATAEVLKVLALVVAPFVFYFEYQQKIAADISERALTEISTFQKEEVYNALDESTLAFLDVKLVRDTKAAGLKALDTRSLCPYHNYIASLAAPAVPTRRQIVQILDRFEYVAICANSGRCGREELCDAFALRMHAFSSDLCTVIHDIENLWHRSITRQTRKFLASCPINSKTICEEIAAESKKSERDLMAECYSE